MEEIIKIEDDLEEIVKCNILFDADKIPKDECKVLFMYLNQIVGFGKKIAGIVKQDGQYVVKVPKDIREGLAKGIYWFTEKKDGGGVLPDVWELTPDGKKQIKERLTLDQNFSADGLSDMLQNYAMQQQMAEMAEELKEIHQEITHIQKGMDNDRVAKVEAAFDKLKYASTISDDPEMRKSLIISAIDNLTLGAREIEKELKLKLEDFEAIPQSDVGIGFHMLVGFKNYKEKKDRAADEIDKFFTYYEKAMELLAYSFLITNQMESVKMVYDEYRRGIAGLPLENFRTIQYLHPGLDFSDKWFTIPEEYVERLPQKIEAINISKNDYIGLRISGELLQEVV